MKKLFNSTKAILFISLLSLTGISCSKNNVVPENPSEKWENQKDDQAYDYIITPESVTGDFRTYFQKIATTYNDFD